MRNQEDRIWPLKEDSHIESPPDECSFTTFELIIAFANLIILSLESFEDRK